MNQFAETVYFIASILMLAVIVVAIALVLWFIYIWIKDYLNP